jgi:tryptophan-rich hypothetical protein
VALGRLRWGKSAIAKARSDLKLRSDIWRVPVNRINPRKLLNSKWTAVNPTNREKHFLVSAIEFDEEGAVIFCSLEAVMSKRWIPIEWKDLQDGNRWIHGWK